MRPFLIIVGVVEIGCAVLQYLASRGKVELRTWPFVQSAHRTTQVMFALLFLFVGLGLVAIGLFV